MKVPIVSVIFSLILTWFHPTLAQGDVAIPPTITSIFPAVHYIPGPASGKWKRITYKCDQYTGIPKPNIYWQYFKNGVFKDRLYPDSQLPRTYNGSVLMLKYIEPNEQFQCVAENTHGVALSTKMQIYQAAGANFDGKVKDNPFSFSSQVGQPLIIPCKYSTPGVPDNIFSWKYSIGKTGDTKNVLSDDRIFISVNGSLAFSYLKYEDGQGKIYSCHIENIVLSLVKYGSWTDLEVKGSPNDIPPDSPATLLYSTANNTVAHYKKDFKMQCIFGGNPVPKVQWERPYSSRQSIRFTENSNNELVVSSILEEDEGFYKCTSVQKLGSPLVVRFFIDVKGPPIWVNKPKSLIVAQGMTGVFHCNARPLKGEKALARPKWYKNGKLLRISPGQIQMRTHLSPDGKTLTITDAQKPNDICNYQCSVANEQGEIFADAAFNVILNTEVIVAPESQTIDKGEVAIFNVKATTDPLKEAVLEYIWILNGRKIEFLDLHDILRLNNNSLLVNTTGMDDSRYELVLGNYSVNITNGVETVTRYASLMGNPVKNPVVSESGMDLRWIALIVAVVLLFIIFILLLCVLFNKHGGDDYSVDKKERKAGHDPEKELADSGFHDLPRTDDDPDKQKPDNVSISSTAKSMASETDSMEEYSEADAGSRFNEDGSFIGAYQGHESKGNVSNV